jgi:hypothetical protein
MIEDFLVTGSNRNAVEAMGKFLGDSAVARR